VISRALTNRIDSWLFKGKIILLSGPAHVGKTTLCKQVLKTHQQEQAYFSCLRHNVRTALQKGDIAEIKKLVGSSRLAVFDDADGIENIGTTLKALREACPDLQIIACSSSRIDFPDTPEEPAYQYVVPFMLHPLSLNELQGHVDEKDLDARLGDYLRFGLCPAVLSAPAEQRKEILMALSEEFLYKDLLQFESMKNANKMSELLKVLAANLGEELSVHELAATLDFSRSTVERFLTILEKTFVIIKAPSFTRNFKRELNKKAKYYFYDLGFRNALLNKFDTLDRHPDVDALWENFCVLERLKFLSIQGHYPNIHFWRTHDRQKVGYLEDRNNALTGFEFKWSPQRKAFNPPKAFSDHYPETQVRFITQQNWQHLFY
jgi:predicted AAA+ superfamily ATPase